MVELRPAASTRGRTPRTVAAFSVGWLLIAAATAGAVVAVGKSSGGSSQNAAMAVAATPTSTSAMPSASASMTTTSSAPTPSTTPTTPKPVSTVTGQVATGALHSGDIRFFLMPVPADGSVIGAAADGTPLTKDAVAGAYQDSAAALTELNQLGYQDGAFRDYQTGDAKYHVVVRLWHFSSAQNAKLWFQGDLSDPAAKPFSINDFPDAKGVYLAPVKPGDPANMRGLYYVGDVCFEIVVIGVDPMDRNVLADRMHKQVDRLTKGT